MKNVQAWLLGALLLGMAGYALWDRQRDAALEAGARAEVAEMAAKLGQAAREVRAAEQRSSEAHQALADSTAAWEAERRDLRRRADAARERGEAIADSIVAAFPSAEEMVRRLEAEHNARVAAVERDRDSAMAEVAVLREVGLQDARLFQDLRAERDAALTLAEAAHQGRVAAERAAASRASWLKIGGGALTVLLVALALAAS